MNERPPHRRKAIALLAAGITLLAIAGASEWRAAAWWSPVTKVEQRFVAVCRGQLRVGVRGTAGFFTRAIARPGWALSPPGWVVSDLPQRLWLPGYFTKRQTRAVSIPLYPLGALVAVAGIGLRLRYRFPPGHCRACGYNLEGLPGRCPECGQSR